MARSSDHGWWQQPDLVPWQFEQTVQQLNQGPATTLVPKSSSFADKIFRQSGRVKVSR